MTPSAATPNPSAASTPSASAPSPAAPTPPGPARRRPADLIGAVVAYLAAVFFTVVAVLLIVQWTTLGMLPWSGFFFWWVGPLLALLAVAMYAVGTSFARAWRRGAR